MISIFNEQEIELLMSGLPNIDIEDLKANTEYHKYQANSLQVPVLFIVQITVHFPSTARYVMVVLLSRFNGSGERCGRSIRRARRRSCSS